MRNEIIEQINIDLEHKFGEGGLELTETALGGTQITWKNMCLGSADLETIDEIMDQLRFLRTEVYYGNKLSRARRQRNEDGGR